MSAGLGSTYSAGGPTQIDGSKLINVPAIGGITQINGDPTAHQTIAGQLGVIVVTPGPPGTTTITINDYAGSGTRGAVPDLGLGSNTDYLAGDGTWKPIPIPTPPATDGFVQVLGRVAVDLNAAGGTQFPIFTVPPGKRAIVLEFLADEFSATPVNAALDFGDSVDSARWDFHNGNIDFSAGGQQPVRLSDYTATVSNRNSTPTFAAGDVVVTAISNPEGAAATCFVSAIGYYR